MAFTIPGLAPGRDRPAHEKTPEPCCTAATSRAQLPGTGAVLSNVRRAGPGEQGWWSQRIVVPGSGWSQRKTIHLVISVPWPTTCAQSSVAGVPSQSSPSLTRPPGTDDLGHRRDQEQLTYQHLKHGQGLARVTGRDKVAVPGGGERGKREEQVLRQRASALGPEERRLRLS